MYRGRGNHGETMLETTCTLRTEYSTFRAASSEFVVLILPSHTDAEGHVTSDPDQL